MSKMILKKAQRIGLQGLSRVKNAGFFIKSHPFLAPGLYIFSGLVVFFILIMMFNTYVLRLKIEMAVVNAPIESIVAPMSGYITEVYVASGDQVKKGMPLLKIENIDLERDLRLAKILVKESTLSIEYYEQLLSHEQQKLKIYKRIGHNRVTSANALVNSSKQDRMAAKKNFERVEVLYKKNYMTKANLESAYAKYVRANEQFRHAKAQQHLQDHSLHAVDQGVFFTGNKLEGTGQHVLAKLEAEKKKKLLNQSRVELYTYLSEKLVLKAPFDGTINQLIKSAGNTTDHINPLVLIEKDNIHRNIIAYLTQKEIAHIGDTRQVKIYLPSTGSVYRGKVTEIDRTDGFVDLVKAQFRWRDLEMDRSGRVIIDIQPSEQIAFDDEAFAGMPVVVYFSKKFFL